MARKEQVELEYIAKLDSLTRELSKMPGISDKAAKRMVKGWDRELKRQTKIAEHAARAQQDAWKRAGEGAEGVKRIFDAAGGSAAGFAGTVEHAARSVLALSSALGPVGVVAVGTIAALGGIAAAAGAAALKGEELQKSLTDQGRRGVVTGEQRKQLQQVSAAWEELTASSSEFVVQLGAEVAPAVSRLVLGLADTIDNLRGWVKWGGEAIDTMSELATGGIVSDLAAWVGVTEELVEQNRQLTQARKDARKAAEADAAYLKILDAAIEERNNADKKAAEEKAKATEKAAEMAQRQAEAEQKAGQAALDRLQRQAHLVSLNSREKMAFLLEEQLAEAQHAAEVTGNHAQALEVRKQLVANYHAAIEAMDLEAMAKEEERRQQRVKAEKAALHQWMGEYARETNRRLEMEREVAEEARQANQERTQAAFQSAGQIAAAVGMLADHYAASQDRMTAKGRRAAEMAYRLQQGVAVSQIAINTAQAIMQSYAQLGPIGGTIAAVGMTAIGAAQAGVVLATPPPQYDTGGMVAPDHQLISAQAGEGVLTRNGVRNIGGPDALDALNQGRSTGGPMVIEQRYRHRTLDRVLADNIRRGGPLGGALDNARGRLGHSGRKAS